MVRKQLISLRISQITTISVLQPTTLFLKLSFPSIMPFTLAFQYLQTFIHGTFLNSDTDEQLHQSERNAGDSSTRQETKKGRMSESDIFCTNTFVLTFLMSILEVVMCFDGTANAFDGDVSNP